MSGAGGRERIGGAAPEAARPAAGRFGGKLAAACLLALGLLAGCTRSHPGVQPEELRIAARWIEDVAHGIPRRAGELDPVQASEEQRRLAAWAIGDDISGRRVPPRQLRARVARWPSLAAALRSRLLLIDRERGLVGPEPTLAPGDFALAAGIADAENADRRTIDAIVLARAQASQEATAWYADAVRSARVELDAAAGGSAWEPESR